MKYIKQISSIVIILGFMALSMAPLLVKADSKEAMSLLDRLGASFIIHDKGDSLSIITYDCKTPGETYKILKNAGIKVDRVVNYRVKADKPAEMTFKNYLITN